MADLDGRTFILISFPWGRSATFMGEQAKVGDRLSALDQLEGAHLLRHLSTLPETDLEVTLDPTSPCGHHRQGSASLPFLP